MGTETGEGPPLEKAASKRAAPPHSGALIAEMRSEHRGPLPSPDDLAAYDRVKAGLAGTIVEMAIREQHHRHDRENDEQHHHHKSENEKLVGEIVTTTKGQIFAFILGLVGLVAASLIIY